MTVLVLAAWPATAELTLSGVREGQVVTGPVELAAYTSLNQTRDLRITLTGPDGETVARNLDIAGRHVNLLHAPGQPRVPVAWDIADAAEGTYTLHAQVRVWTPRDREIRKASVRFTVVPPRAATAEAPAGDENPSVITVSGGADAAETTPVVAAAAAASVETTAATPEAQAETTAAAGFGFAAGALTQRVVGDDRPIALRLPDNLGGDEDVLIIAWDDDRRRIVDGVGLLLDGGADQVPASLLDQLPLGNVEVQAIHRRDGRVLEIVKHKLVNGPAPTPDALPAIAFAADTLTDHTVGDDKGLSFEVDGDLPATADVLVIAWSLQESRIVDGFAQVMTDGPWEIGADRLDLLPPGPVEVQLRPRIGGEIVGKIARVINVSTPVASGGGGGGDSASDKDAGDDSGDNDGGQVADGSYPGDDGDNDAGDPADPVDPDPAPVAPIDLAYGFPGDLPDQYVVGSDAELTVELSGPLPSGADVLMIVWHNDESRLIDGFAHELSAAPFRIDNAKLDVLPPGSAELQALLRIPGQPIEVRKRGITIVDPNAPVAEQPGDNDLSDPGGDADYDGLNLTADGFTKFTKSDDTRVIYVAEDGDNNNDGLSPERPMRTAYEAYKKLRNGKPDWLLFKAGDTFRGNLGSVNKSGRSKDEPMLIGVYGEGPRPIMESPRDTWAFKAFTAPGDHLAIVGLHIVAVNRIPDRPGFNPNMDTAVWRQGGITFLGDTKDFLIEDCILEYFQFAIVVQGNDHFGFAQDVRIRRTSVLNCYGHWNADIGGHSSGAYLSWIDGLLIEECVWDSNGFNERVDGASRTKFNHNIYIQTSAKNCVVRDSIITNGSAHGLQLRPGGRIENNLFALNPLAFFTGRYESHVKRNVILQSIDLSSKRGDERGMGIEILPCVHAYVENNILSQKRGSADHAEGIVVNYSSEYMDWLDGRPYRVTLKNNKIHDWPYQNGEQSAIRINTGAAQIVANSGHQLDRRSGGSSDPPWVDPDRDIESYMQSIGQPASYRAFIEAAVYRPRGVWVEAYSADAVNNHVRRGFDIKPHD
ncbi:MAG: right-handed parallel beta-helix repeat-containing protein [Planctomycetota bacterium]